MNKKEMYRLRNEAYLADKAKEDGVAELEGGVLYRVTERGEGPDGITRGSVVTVHYTGSLISGKEFDNSWARRCPEAFRVSDLIEGFQTALCHMRVGDRWQVFIPWQRGYGKRAAGDIPGCSTLVFDIKLISLA